MERNMDAEAAELAAALDDGVIRDVAWRESRHTLVRPIRMGSGMIGRTTVCGRTVPPLRRSRDSVGGYATRAPSCAVCQRRSA